MNRLESDFEDEIRVEETTSTMDLARSLIGNRATLLVMAGTQTGGRGTRGRNWESVSGNIHMTAVFSEDLVEGMPRGLLPLEVGMALHKVVSDFISPPFRPDLKLKWPNDLLVGESKVAGVLMEWYGRHLLCGIGVNVESAPPLTDGGRTSGRLVDFGMRTGDENTLARHIFRELKSIWNGPSDSRTIPALLEGFRSRLDWAGGFAVRQRPELGLVMPADINSEGHLQVKTERGETVWLVSDYPA